MSLHPDIAMLAPVPLGHLEHGEGVSHRKGKVAYGSRAWEFFRTLDSDRSGLEVEAFIYASHADVHDLSVTWHARYVGHVEGVNGQYLSGRWYRPSSTSDDSDGWWAVFWEVADLKRLDTPLPIAELCADSTDEPYGKGFVPEGPMRIARPR